MTYFTLIQSATLGLAKVFVKVSKGAASARRIQEVLLATEDVYKRQPWGNTTLSSPTSPTATSSATPLSLIHI